MQWTNDLAVGVKMIDEQHRELFARIGKLVDSIKLHQCKFEIDGTIDFLGEYVITHFRDEERLMREQGYSDYEAHKAMHDKFIKDFSKLKSDFESEPSSYTRSVYTNQIVVDWIVNHISTIDTKLAGFLKTKGVH